MDDLQVDRLDVALGENVRWLRRQRNMSQQDLGRALGVSFQQVQKYERGTNRISFSTLMRVREALGCSMEDLTVGMDEPAVAGPARPPLVPAEAAAILDGVAQIRSARLRRAVLEFVRALVRD